MAVLLWIILETTGLGEFFRGTGDEENDDELTECTYRRGTSPEGARVRTGHT